MADNATVDTILSAEDIKAVKDAINAYRTSADALFTKLQKEVTTLQGSGFMGQASTGYSTFVTDITPALTTQLTGTTDSVTALLDNWINAVEETLLNQVDPELKKNNENAAK